MRRNTTLINKINKKYCKLLCFLFGHKLSLVNFENQIKESIAYKEKHNKAWACERCYYMHSYREDN